MLGELGRLGDALAGLVVEPAVIGAAQPLILGNAAFEIDAAMGAALADQAETALAVAIKRQRLAEDAHRLDGVRLQLPAGRDRMPVAAHQRPHPAFRSDAGQELVLLGGQHGSASFSTKTPSPPWGRGSGGGGGGGGGGGERWGGRVEEDGKRWRRVVRHSSFPSALSASATPSPFPL